MAASKYKGFRKKKLNPDHGMVSGLRKQNAYLRKTLAELSHQHSEYYRLIERFLSLETIRLESSQPPPTKDEKTALPPEQMSNRGRNPLTEKITENMKTKRSIASYAREIEEIKNKLVVVSARCQYLENKLAREKDLKTEEMASTTSVPELQNHLKIALEKNKQWLEYDQQREAYVRAILARMLWLEKQLNEANQAHSQQHNEDHSDDKELIQEMQEHYERLLQKAKDELEVLREEVDMTNQKLIKTQNRGKEQEKELEELKQLLQTETMHRKCAPKQHHCPEEEQQRLKDETKDLQCRLDQAKRKSANFELQANLFQKFMLNRHHEDQEKIAELERQRDHQDCNSCEEAHPPSQLSTHSLTSSPNSSWLNESILECPGCQAEYAASHYRELMNHLDICLV
ncbi:centrosomal protein of 55 kDa-like [Mastacembelus armatus]|uniref:centrosomal protein of 55 kDa-like n=1 Tax=Mastacembelus armatus TaxID=205130 RepID=UPI000E4623DB|nr:centrosomal protein of 55 kDa-like [Mastacembelus armatus]XP_026165391.1 centrosomal protein of 55 kDa-like [Mastacembelus armatus]